jgi:hypothetical protein
MNAAVTPAERAALLAPVKTIHADADAALSDVDTYTDWLAGECMHQHEVSSHGLYCQFRMPGEPFDLGLYQTKLDGATVAQLLHISLECVDERRVLLAIRELKARYLRAQGLQP